MVLTFLRMVLLFLMLGHISLEGLLSTLWENKMRSVMVEGGASVISSFLKSGLVDSFLLTIAPVYVGKDGVSAVEDAEVKNISGSVYDGYMHSAQIRLGGASY